jgi:hypothetical protein
MHHGIGQLFAEALAKKDTTALLESWIRRSTSGA